MLSIRAATLENAEAIADVYFRSRREFVACAPLARTETEVCHWIRGELISKTTVSVAVANDQIVGFSAHSTRGGYGWIDQLYLAPGWTGRGIGATLLQRALPELPPPIRLYTFQANTGARRFYERHGFRAIGFGDGVGNEERCPDVLYEWRLPASDDD